jgi:hypothetical protein
LIKIIFALVILGLSPLAICETYLGLNPNDSLTSIKEKFPNAIFSNINAAWLQPHERFMAMSGQGLVGTVYLKLGMTDATFRKKLEKLDAEIAMDPGPNSAERRHLASIMRAALARPIDEQLGLDWLRWVPPSPIPMSRVQAKYGKPDTCDYDETTFSPYCKWNKKAIYANVSDKKDFVLNLEFTFTQAEWDKAWGYKE